MSNEKTSVMKPTPRKFVDRPHPRLLSQVSLPAVLAAALTAVTSFAFSSRLGLTGSLIGAALAAVVSTIASQVYNAMIKTSVEIIVEHAEPKSVIEEESEETVELHPLEKTEVRSPFGLVELEANEGMVESGTPVAPAALREEAARRHLTTMRQRGFAVAAGIGLLSLLVYGILLTIATKGEGIGPKTVTELTQPAVVEEKVETETSVAPVDESVQTQETTPTTQESTSASTTEDASETTPNPTDTTSSEKAEEPSVDQPATPAEPTTPPVEDNTTTETPAETTAPVEDAAQEPGV